VSGLNLTTILTHQFSEYHFHIAYRGANNQPLNSIVRSSNALKWSFRTCIVFHLLRILRIMGGKRYFQKISVISWSLLILME